MGIVILIFFIAMFVIGIAGLGEDSRDPNFSLWPRSPGIRPLERPRAHR